MNAGHQSHEFARLQTKVGCCPVAGRTVLIPDMAPCTARMMAAAFRAFGVSAEVMDTCREPHTALALCSGKECLPCHVTLGDIIAHLRSEQTLRGDAFASGDYVYFLPTSNGPCRFGMYSTFQRLALDRCPDLAGVTIACFSTETAYSAAGIMPDKHAGRFKRLLYMSMLVADAMDRMVWRVRPYERESGATDALMAESMSSMRAAIERCGTHLSFARLYRTLDALARAFSTLIDPRLSRKPRIAVVGEIYLRSHPRANRHLVRDIERLGGEVVVSSIVEWLHFVGRHRARMLRRDMRRAWIQQRVSTLARSVATLMTQETEAAYWSWLRNRVYRCVQAHLDIHSDHDMRRIEACLDRGRLYSFELGSEAPVTIGAALEYANEGFAGIVNVFPFTCMPGAASAAVLGRELRARGVPYLDSVCDGAVDPQRETALRTFMSQAHAIHTT